jgi:AcrR family transcriptional regulator
MRNIEKDEIEMAAKRELMLKKGFEIFSKKGIESVAMQEIANACSVGIATLYRYYNTKLALVIDIATRQWQDYIRHINKLREKEKADDMTAAEEFEFYLNFYIELYEKYKPLLCFNQDFNNYVQHEKADAKQLKPYIESIGEIAKMFHSVYEKGKKDGTLRTELSEEKMFAATSHIMIAVAVRYAQGLLYSRNEADRTEEFLLLKQMMMNEYVIR